MRFKSFCILGLGFVGLISAGLPASAQVCGRVHTVRAQDTLSSMSKSAYGTPVKWRVIYNANYKTIGSSPTFIFPGQRLLIPCNKGRAPKLVRLRQKKNLRRAKQRKVASGRTLKQGAPKQVARALPVAPITPGVSTNAPKIAGDRQIRLLTASDYKPFTDKKLPEGGMVSELVTKAFASAKQRLGGPGVKVSWVNDWSAHLDPLLVNQAFDMGFPWFKPNCKHYNDLDKPAKFRCDNFLFSKPVFEILVVFFKNKKSSFRFSSDSDVVGKTLCRPAGYFTFDLDDNGRNWVRDKLIKLEQPQSVDKCFEMLQSGQVDAVALNEFTGKAAVSKMQLGESVEVLERPVSILNLHVIVAKTHKQAKGLLNYVNQGLALIRAEGTYGEIVDRHLTRFWANQGPKS